MSESSVQLTKHTDAAGVFSPFIYRPVCGDPTTDLNRVSERHSQYTLKCFVRFLASVDAVLPNLVEKVMVPSLSPGEEVRDAMIALSIPSIRDLVAPSGNPSMIGWNPHQMYRMMNTPASLAYNTCPI